MSPEERKVMLHAVGADTGNKRTLVGYRNRYCAAVNAPEHALWEGIVAKGWAERGSPDDRMTRFWLTLAGCVALGLTKAATERALSP